MDVRTWVLLAQNVVEMRRNAVKNRVTDDNWVNVDANRNVQRTADVALRAVDNLVNRDEIRVGGYFPRESTRRIAPARSRESSGRACRESHHIDSASR